MKKFKFSLQVLLDVRNREEKNAKNELSISKMELLKLEKQLEDLMLEKEKCENELIKASQNIITPDKIHTYYIYLNKLENLIDIKKNEVHNMEIKCEKIMEKLIEIRKMVKMIEILKEQKYQEYLKETEIEEMKLIDDFINSREIHKLMPRH